MEKIMRLGADERSGLVVAAARKLGLGEAIVEKDLWVTYFLDYLFSRCPHKSEFEFKGGTSLSKCYGIIDRFSEDLDIVSLLMRKAEWSKPIPMPQSASSLESP